MELYLQFGYGMMSLSKELFNRWDGGTVILSPRDLKPTQLEKFSEEISGVKGSVLLDPQFYLPHADHGKLTTHSFWPDSYNTTTFWSSSNLVRMLKEIIDINNRLGCRMVILPGVHVSSVDDMWIGMQEAVFNAIEHIGGLNTEAFATVALSEDILRQKDQINLLLEEIDHWPVSGIYLVCEHPRGNYLVEDPGWLSNVLDLSAGIRLTGKRLIVGYCNHQMLYLAASGADAIASGTWMNVRSFPPAKFMDAINDEIRQRAVWYYCPTALSEYKLPTLDIAQRLGILDLLKAPEDIESEYAENIFSGSAPSVSGFSEREAFRHYLNCLKQQVDMSSASSFRDTLTVQRNLLNDANSLLIDLHDNDIRGQQRDFRGCIDSSMVALRVLEKERGAIMQRMWSTL
ncbi:MAG: hypothetical protein AB2710_19990 [Candidatus Thiodiazotropha sp.]